jgi:hypothetical protein
MLALCGTGNSEHVVGLFFSNTFRSSSWLRALMSVPGGNVCSRGSELLAYRGFDDEEPTDLAIAGGAASFVRRVNWPTRRKTCSPRSRSAGSATLGPVRLMILVFLASFLALAASHPLGWETRRYSAVRSAPRITPAPDVSAGRHVYLRPHWTWRREETWTTRSLMNSSSRHLV